MEIQQQLKWEEIRNKTGFPHILLLSYNSASYVENPIRGIYNLQEFYRQELFEILSKYILTKDLEYERNGIITTSFNCETRLREIINTNFFNRSIEHNTCIYESVPFSGKMKDRTEFMAMNKDLDFVSFFTDPNDVIFKDFLIANTAYPLTGMGEAEANVLVDKKVKEEKRFNKHIMFCVPEKENDLSDLVEIITGYPMLRSDFNEDDFSMKFARVV